jgi:aminoglycoside 6'-N-acetyltransferase I
MNIIKVTQDDFNEWLDLAMQFWSDYSLEEMHVTLTAILNSPHEAAFLVRAEDGSAIAFMNLSLRHDYVPGATQSPVAYIEGIYVKENYRKQGLGKALIQHAEQWAIEQGCTQLASDALLDNTESYEFHTHIGFEEVERVVCFIKPVVASH